MYKKIIFNSAFLCFFFVFIVTPIFTMDVKSEISQENRRLMANPIFPGLHSSNNELRTFTLNVEKWIDDRIGFRSIFTTLYSSFICKALQTPSHIQIMLGKDGHVFLASHASTKQYRDTLTKAVLGIPHLEQARVDGLIKEVSDLKNVVSWYGVPVALVTIPQKHLLDYDKLPFYIEYFVTQDIIERPLDLRVAQALPADAIKLIFPYAEARVENNIDRLYPQQNFHWAPGRFTKLMAAKVAEAFGAAAYEAPGLEEFEQCEMQSDLSNIAGFPMAGQGYLCYKKDVFRQLGIHASVLVDAYPSLSGLIKFSTYRRNVKKQNRSKLLWLGDSFSPMIANDMARYYEEVLCINGWDWKVYTDNAKLHLKDLVEELISTYKPNYIVLSRHYLDALPSLVRDLTPQ